MLDKELFSETKNHMTGAIEHLKQELRALRAGRANSSLVEGIHVDVYGSVMKVKEVATITTPEPRQLLITPFDASNAGHIAKAIDKANLGLRVSVEGKFVRVTFPELDQNRRKELVGQVHKKREDCKISIRNIRRDSNEKTKKLKDDGDLPEDDYKKLEKQIQDLTNQFCKEADETSTAKENEIMTV
jgi:ribosome recycling factor